MARKAKKQREITADQLGGFKQLRRVAQLLSTLHEAGCDRGKAHNRELHFDDYVLLILLYLFNPLIDSMRTLQKVAELPEVRKRLGIKDRAMGTYLVFICPNNPLPVDRLSTAWATPRRREASGAGV